MRKERLNKHSIIKSLRLENVGCLKRAFTKFTNKPLYVQIVLCLFFIYFVIQVFIHLVPFYWVINNSLKTTEEFFQTSSFALTKSWSIKNYIQVFSNFVVRGTGYVNMLFNSIWIAFLYVFTNIMSSVLLAYVVARFRFPGRGFLYGLAIFIRVIPIVGTGAASFKLQVSLGMVNNPSIIWLAWAMGFDFVFIILYGTFKGISSTYSEAAKIDGAGNLTVLLKIIMPQAFPTILALFITNFTAHWNNYAVSQIVLNKFPNLAYGLFIYQLESTWDYNAKGVFFAATIMTGLPVIIIYVLSQNLIIKNVSVGGIKG